MKWKTSNAPKSSVSRAQRRCKCESGSIIIVRLTFQFVDPACLRDTDDLGWKGLAEIQSPQFFRDDCADLDFWISRAIQFQSWGAATEKALSPIFELALGTTSWSSSEERRLRILFKGLSRLCRYTGWHECITLYVRVHILYFILNWTGSQCRDFNKCVTLQNRGERVTTLAKQFWTLCALFISDLGCHRG